MAERERKPTGLYRPSDGLLIAGRYKIEDPEPIGRGGMGLVYRGYDIRMKKPVAIKVLHEQFEGMPEVVARFRKETDAVNRLGHEGIVVILDQAMPDETPVFIVMEFLDGKTLAQALEDKDLGAKMRHLQHIRYLGARLLEIMQVVHERDIIHRDLKPENIFLLGPLNTNRKYPVKIIDFGIAKFREADTKLTQVGTVVGTPTYMSPEQVQGHPVDHRTDLYAIGCVLYEMATGRPPFVGDLAEVQQGHIHTLPDDPSDLNGEIPPALDLVIETALAKDPDKRFPDAVAMREALEDAIPEDKMFWRESRPPSPVNGKTVAARAPRLLPKCGEGPARHVTPPDEGDVTPTRLVPDKAAAVRAREALGRARTITPERLAKEASPKWWRKIPRGARWSLFGLLVLVIMIALVAIILPSRSDSKVTNTATEARDAVADTTTESTKRDVIMIPMPVFVPTPSRDAEAETSKDVTDASEADASTPEADAEDATRSETTDAEAEVAASDGYASHMASGEAAMTAKDWRLAASEFRTAAETRPTEPHAKRRLGDALLRLGQNDEAMAAYCEYLRLWPEAPDAPYLTGLTGDACLTGGR